MSDACNNKGKPMQITSEPLPNRLVKITLDNDGEYIIPKGVHRRLSSDEYPDEHTFLLELCEATETYARNKTAYLLGLKPYTRKKLYENLIKSGVDEEIAEDILDEFEQAGYINDEKYAADMLNIYINEKFYSIEYAIYKLEERGISKATSQKIADEIEINETETALKLLNKKIGTALESNYKKMSNLLTRYGYQSDAQKEAIDMFINNTTHSI